MRKTKSQRGITLIALIITIIILVILAAVAINVALDSGIIDFAIKGVGKYTEASKKEQELFDGTVKDIEDVIKRLKELQGGGAGEKTGPESEYTKVGETYCNSPDLSGFNAECTWYITYDEDGNEKIAGRVDMIDAPDEWYDYGARKWANVVTVNENNVTYWVWIPRYKYKINADNAENKVDAKFVTIENNKCKEIKNGVETEVNLNDYTLPDSFTFGEKNLAGYWISKYEVQISKENGEETIQTIEEGNKKKVTTTNPSGKYTIYVDGLKVAEHTDLPYSLEKFESLKKYTIMLVSETNNKIVGSRNMTSNSNIEIDLSGFNPECTWYVIYDEEGKNEQIGEQIKLDKNGKATNMPENWYNYDDKRWANIVTENNGLTTYWTYIPRYECKIWSSAQYTEVNFIPKSQTEADSEYIIPESFKFGGEDLAGYWISKYEVQEVNEVKNE